MKKILSILIIGILFAVNIYAEPRFKEDGTCYKCDGKGKYKNRNYNRKKMGSRKYLKCPDCKGQGKKPRKIDGKLLITKNRRRYKNYSIDSINEKGISITYKNSFREAKIFIKNKFLPKQIQADIAKKLYIDSDSKLYIAGKTPKRDQVKIGSCFIAKGAPVNFGKFCDISIIKYGYFIRIFNAKTYKLKYNHQQELALLIIGKLASNRFSAKVLSKPTEAQLKAYFSGKPIKPAINNQLSVISKKP